MRANLERQFATKVTERLERRAVRHLRSLPWRRSLSLILLGRLVGDITPCVVHQLQREPQTWRWQSSTPRIEFSERRPIGYSTTPALVLGISATIVEQQT